MFDAAVRSLEFFTCSLEDLVVCLRVIDLMSRALGSSIKTQKRNAFAQLAVDAAASLFQIWPWSCTNNPAGILGLGSHDIGVLELHSIGCRGLARGLRRLGSICAVCRRGRGNVMLKEKVIFVCHTSYAAKDGAFHEVVYIAAVAILRAVSEMPFTVFRYKVQVPTMMSWSSHIFSCAIWPLASANSSVPYQRT